MRQVVLDTETTGLDPQQGHRIIEIGCVELEDRKLTGKHFQVFLNPEREIDDAAIEVHGITLEFLTDKPRFYQIEQEFLDFINGTELIIHNAPFDVGFLNMELDKTASSNKALAQYCSVLDTLLLAKEMHPGQRNSLDALCKRYSVDNNHRTLHGALLDAEILADVYIAMTSGQSSLSLDEGLSGLDPVICKPRKRDLDRQPIPTIYADREELEDHRARLEELEEQGVEGCLWIKLEAQN
ncbi:MAG: DNA polymerase III subunit epsilon [Gammaproteobacteria bacterium]|nr:DNA polymerase III subunit epsilon [Gammaproteobacteria bacterium]|tara:strand:+ start:535 stop:1254 length:720 start_codon:yes stop_codon:yes gene_type:complete